MNVRELKEHLQRFPDGALIGGATREGGPPFDVHAITAINYVPYLAMTGVVILFNEKD